MLLFQVIVCISRTIVWDISKMFDFLANHNLRCVWLYIIHFITILALFFCFNTWAATIQSANIILCDLFSISTVTNVSSHDHLNLFLAPLSIILVWSSSVLFIIDTMMTFKILLTIIRILQCGSTYSCIISPLTLQHYDLITWVKMFVSDNQLGLICVFVFKLTIRSIKYRGP